MKTLAQQRCKAEIVRRVRTVHPESARRWGQMSAHQMICHLCDSFRMATGQKLVSDASGRMQRTLVKWIALYLPVQWPVGLQTRPEVRMSQAAWLRWAYLHMDHHLRQFGA